MPDLLIPSHYSTTQHPASHSHKKPWLFSIMLVGLMFGCSKPSANPTQASSELSHEMTNAIQQQNAQENKAIAPSKATSSSELLHAILKQMVENNTWKNIEAISHIDWTEKAITKNYAGDYVRNAEIKAFTQNGKKHALLLTFIGTQTQVKQIHVQAVGVENQQPYHLIKILFGINQLQIVADQCNNEYENETDPAIYYKTQILQQPIYLQAQSNHFTNAHVHQGTMNITVKLEPFNTEIENQQCKIQDNT